MVGETEVLALAGGAISGGLVQVIGAWFIISRLKKVDAIERKMNALITFFRITDPKFAKFWKVRNSGD